MAWWKILLALAAVGLLVGGGFLYAAFGAFLPWRERDEIARLATLVGVRPGQHVAEIGAGRGRFARGLLDLVGPSGRVYATEVSPERLRDLRALTAQQPNLIVIEGADADTNLPDGCCDVVLMRAVYHHVGQPEAFARSVVRALKPGGRLVVIDFEPAGLWLHGGRPDQAAPRRSGHGVSRSDASDEFRAAGLTLQREVASWSGPLWLLQFVR